MAALELLRTEKLCRQYGGLMAVDQVDFRLEQGQIRAIIGPNGAGKTTLVSLICGRTPASSGRIFFKGQDISSSSPARRVQAGIVYTFQVTSIFSKLSCYENVALAAQRFLKDRPDAQGSVREQDIASRVAVCLKEVGLAGVEEQEAGTLPYGHQKLLEVAMSLATGPELLILDEPTQGLAESEIQNLMELIRTISQSATVLLIEHNMPFVLNLAEQITVMTHGSILAEGTPEEIANHRDVQVAYLGT